MTKKQFKFKVTLKMNDTEYKGSGDDLKEIVLAFNPPFFKTGAVLEVQMGKQKTDQYYPVFRAKKLYTNKIFLECQMKWIEMRFKE